MIETSVNEPRVAVRSFGCRLNIAESEAIATMLRDAPLDRDVVVINGCAVTGNAMRDARTAVRQAKRDHPDTAIIAAGCAAQVDPAMFAAMPEVDRVLGNGEKLTRSAFDNLGHRDAPRIIVGDAMALTRTAPQLIAAFVEHARGFLEVQNGCDHRCTFCVIPYGRGPSRSVPVDAAVDAATRLVDGGHRELVLTGVDLTSYGHDLPGTPTLATLIHALLDRVSGLARVRLGSIDVAEIDEPLFELLTQESRMMPHVHLSLQHGHDLILKRMKRRHSRAMALAMIARLQATRPAVAIGTDLISGFPTEDDAMHRANLSLIEEGVIRFAHIFPYSARDGTPAARMPQLPRDTIRQRAAELRAVASSARRQWLSDKFGTIATMLVERDGLTGHADDFARIRLNAPTEAGSIAKVRITGLDGDTLIGEGAA